MQLPGRDDPGSVLPLLRGHLDGCLACQAEAVRYRKLSRALASLGPEWQEAPTWLPERVEAAIDGGDVSILKSPVFHAGRVAAAAGAAVAAAGTVVVVRWLRARAA